MLIVKSKFLISSFNKVYKDYALVIQNQEIVDMLANNLVEEKYPGKEIIDKSDSIIMPGFINSHMHQYGVLSRGIPANVEFKDFEGFLWDYWWPLIEDRIGLKEVIATTWASAIELIESGVVIFCDTLEAPKTEEGTLIEQGKVLEEIGMKAILSLESSERIDYENGVKCLDENVNLINWSRENSNLISGALCTHTSFTCSEEFLKLGQSKAKELNSLWQFHLSESIYEVNYCLKNFKKLPVRYYEDLNLLYENILASQVVKINSEEIEILRNRNVRLVHMPLSNCEVGGGFAPVPQLLEKGLDVGLGTDGYINDFFQVMKAAFLIHKANMEDASVMPANVVFKMATENGAKILGFKDTGKLIVGNKGDFIIYNDNFKTPITMDNIFDQIVVHGEKESIDSVYINGKAVFENKELKTIDKNKAVKEMRNVAEEFWKF